jgi:hypothetical protein
VYEHPTGTSSRRARRKRSLAFPPLLRRTLALSPRLHLARRALTLGTGLAAAVPVIVATVRAVRAGWIPGADQAIIATRAYDVFTSHPPLVGQYTLAGDVTGRVTHSLGPMLFWLLAIPSHFGSVASMTWTMGAFNALCVVGAVALARRRGGFVLMFATAIAIALMCQSLAAETFHDVWNPSAGLFPFTLEIFLCWSLACGEYRLLPLTALVASFVVQAHLMFLLPTAGLLVVGVGGLALSRWLAGRPHGEGVARQDTVGRGMAGPRRRSLALWSVAALLVLAFCWSAPVVEQLREQPGNMTLVLRSATAHKVTLGAGAGLHAVVRAVGLRPWWLYVPGSRWERKYDVRSTPSSRAVDSCIALLAALLVVMVAAAIRRRRDVAAGALIGFVLCGALAAVAASTPTPRVLSATLGYTMWWGSQVGMWVWLMLAWSGWLGLAWLARGLARMVAVRSRRSRRPLAAPAQRMPTLVGLSLSLPACVASLAATAAVGAAVAATGKPDEHEYLYRATSTLAAHLDRTIPPDHTIELLGSLNIATMPIRPALRYLLVRHHVRPMAPSSYRRLGDWYELYDRPYQEVAYVEDGTGAPTQGARLLDRVRFASGWGPQTVSLWLLAGQIGGRKRELLPRSQSINCLPSRQIASRHIKSANAISTAACPRSAGPRKPSDASRTSWTQ